METAEKHCRKGQMIENTLIVGIRAYHVTTIALPKFNGQ